MSRRRFLMAGSYKSYPIYVYGVTTQASTPSPEDDEPFIVTTYKGVQLYGVPFVGGNFTDEHGKEWMSDVLVDYGDRMEITRYTYRTTLTTHSWNVQDTRESDVKSFYQSTSRLPYLPIFPAQTSQRYSILSNHFVGGEAGNSSREGGKVALNASSSNLLFSMPTSIATTVSQFIAWMETHPIELIYVLRTPIYEII